MVMDEASQFQEATAVGAIAHAVKQGKLRRILLIGDDYQLPPTVMSKRNPFRETAKVSLFQRLIEAGLQPLILDTQYRMAPTISQAVQDLIYYPASINLTNGPETAKQGGRVVQFHQFLQDFGKLIGQKLPATNSVIILPEE
jgi:superfamily I DNA and/or RNA helicase